MMVMIKTIMNIWANTISQEPIDVCTINDKIKDNIILESNSIALSDNTNA